MEEKVAEADTSVWIGYIADMNRTFEHGSIGAPLILIWFALKRWTIDSENKLKNVNWN